MSLPFPKRKFLYYKHDIKIDRLKTKHFRAEDYSKFFHYLKIGRILYACEVWQTIPKTFLIMDYLP